MSATPLTQNTRLIAWVEEMAGLFKPDDISWCDGSQDEYDRLAAECVASGIYLAHEDNAPTPTS